MFEALLLNVGKVTNNVIQNDTSFNMRCANKMNTLEYSNLPTTGFIEIEFFLNHSKLNTRVQK